MDCLTRVDRLDSVASHSGPPGRGMASLVAPSNRADLITDSIKVYIVLAMLCSASQ